MPAVTFLFFATHKAFHHILKEDILFMLSFDDISDASDVLGAAKHMAHEDIEVLAIALSLQLLIFGWTVVAHGREAEERCRTQAHVLV